MTSVQTIFAGVLIGAVIQGAVILLLMFLMNRKRR